MSSQKKYKIIINDQNLEFEINLKTTAINVTIYGLNLIKILHESLFLL